MTSTCIGRRSLGLRKDQLCVTGELSVQVLRGASEGTCRRQLVSSKMRRTAVIEHISVGVVSDAMTQGTLTQELCTVGAVELNSCAGDLLVALQPRIPIRKS